MPPPPLSDTYANAPLGATTTDSGRTPAGNGEPETAVTAPVAASMAITETFWLPWLATSRNLPLGSTAAPYGSKAPTRNGEPVIAVSAPLVESMADAQTRLPA